MRKVLLLIAVLFSFSVSGFCAEAVSVTSAVTSASSATIAVATTDTVYTKSFATAYGKYYGVWYKATSSGTVDLTVELEQSYTIPATEGSSDTNWAVIEDTGTVASVSDENAHIDRLYPKPMPYSRFKITGGASNDSTTTISVKVATQS